MKTKGSSLSALLLIVMMIMSVCSLLAQPEELLLWNTMDSQEDVVNSKVGPNILLTSYKVPHWTESRIEEGKFGNGLFINNGLGGSEWYNGANFFALDNQAMGLSPERGTIEFWFKFMYDCTIHNHAYIFVMEDDFTAHYTSWPPSRPATRFFAGWSGWNTSPVRKFYFLYAQNDNNGEVVPLHLPEGSTLPGQDMEFFTGQLTHFAFVWDNDGIDGSSETLRIYVDGELKGSATNQWTTTDGILNYTYLGTTPNRDPYDHNYNGLLGVMDNLKVWNYAKTNYEDRHFEGFITCPEDVIIECDVSTDPASTGEPIVLTNCEGEVATSYEDVVTTGLCINEATIERIWTISDACGKTGTCTQMIKIVDTMAPIMMGIPTELFKLQNDPGECGAIPDYSFIEATDGCSEDITLTFNPPVGTLLPVGNTHVAVTAEDACGNTVSETFEIEVFNDPPNIISISAPLDPVKVGNNLEATAEYIDNNVQNVQWDWGDENVSVGVIGEGIITGNHVYSAPGVYTISLSLTDLCGIVSNLEYNYVVIYNSEGGFVTGHGWIESPAGAYYSDPTLVGKANFGFTSKYQKGTTIPTGNTKFKFKMADLKFESYFYDWLVVAGTKAKFKGEGMINDNGVYGFLISAIDGDTKSEPDKFRIKIWEKSTDIIMYDNQLDADENSVPTLEIGAGEITVHVGKDNARTSVNSYIPVKSQTLESISIYPNPANQFIKVEFQNDYSLDLNLKLHLFNLTGADLISKIKKNLENNVLLLELENLSSGIYILSIPEFNKRYKLIKQ